MEYNLLHKPKFYVDCLKSKLDRSCLITAEPCLTVDHLIVATTFLNIFLSLLNSATLHIFRYHQVSQISQLSLSSKCTK